eukprot:scaffold765_cov151-Chaetoceros_neogracile.AAC.16
MFRCRRDNGIEQKTSSSTRCSSSAGTDRRHHRVYVVAVVLVLMVRMHSGLAVGISRGTAHCSTKNSCNYANRR